MPRARVGSPARGAVMVFTALSCFVAMGLGSAMVQGMADPVDLPPVGIAEPRAPASAAGVADIAPDEDTGSRSAHSVGMDGPDVDIVATGTVVSVGFGLARAPVVVRAAVIVGGREVGASERDGTAVGRLDMVVPVIAPPFDVAAELVVTAEGDRDGSGDLLARRRFLLRAPAGAGLLGIDRVDGPSGTALAVHAFVPPSAARVNVRLEDQRGVLLGSSAGWPSSATLWGGLMVGTAPVSATVLVGEIAPGSVVDLVLEWDDANGRQTLRRLLVVPDIAIRRNASSDRP